MPRVPVPATDALEITVEHGEKASIVRLRGRLNIDSSPAFRDQLLAILRAQTRVIVIVDLADLSYLDSSGIATLIEGLRIARQRQMTLCLQGLQAPFLHVFQVTGISTLFEESGCGSASSISKVS